jgi:hypothetical protein
MAQTPEERYLTDPAFRLLVDRLYESIASASYTPSELREAVILAAIHYEMRNPMPREWLSDEEAIIRHGYMRKREG